MGEVEAVGAAVGGVQVQHGGGIEVLQHGQQPARVGGGGLHEVAVEVESQRVLASAHAAFRGVGLPGPDGGIQSIRAVGVVGGHHHQVQVPPEGRVLPLEQLADDLLDGLLALHFTRVNVGVHIDPQRIRALPLQAPGQQGLAGFRGAGRALGPVGLQAGRPLAQVLHEGPHLGHGGGALEVCALRNGLGPPGEEARPRQGQHQVPHGSAGGEGGVRGHRHHEAGLGPATKQRLIVDREAGSQEQHQGQQRGAALPGGQGLGRHF